MTGITLVGLGPGAPDQISVGAHEYLSRANEVWVTSTEHPVIAAMMQSGRIRVLEDTDQLSRPAKDGVSARLERVMDLGMRPSGVVLALPGHPIVGNALGAAVWRRGSESGLPCTAIGAPSALDSVISMLPTAASMTLSLCTATTLAKRHVPPFPTDAPALITGLDAPAAVAAVIAVLKATYPATHEITIFSTSGPAAQSVVQVGQLADLVPGAPGVCLYVPPLRPGSSLEALQEVIARLRAPDGCPWDRAQTHGTLRPHLLEEAYETMAAMDSGDSSALREELGDLLLQIILNSQIAAEAGDFTLNDVARGIHDKLIRRHPHVFGELELEDVEGVLSNWERLKEGERAQKGDSSGILGGVPAALPALSQAQEYQDRAARVGFDWPGIGGVLDKIGEEVQEVHAAEDAVDLEAELGDLLFSVVNFSRWKAVDAESALRSANQRFRRRFGYVESTAQREGRRLSQLSLAEMDDLWNQAKDSE